MWLGWRLDRPREPQQKGYYQELQLLQVSEHWLAQKLGLPDDDYLMCQLVQSKADLVASLTDPKLAKKAAVAVDDGSKRRANAIGDFSLSHAPEVLENLLNLKAEAEAASPMMCVDQQACACLRL